MLNEEQPLNKDFVSVFFVFEDWSIDYRRKILVEMKSASVSEKVLKAQNMLLTNLFMIRRLVDRGLSYHIYSEIMKEPFRMKKLVTKLIGYYIQDPDDIISKINDGAAVLQNINSLSLNDMDKIKSASINRNTSIQYLQQRYFRSMEEGDYDGVQVIESLLTDYKSSNFNGFSVLKPLDSLEGNLYHNTFMYSLSEYAQRNVNYCELYNQGFARNLSSRIVFDTCSSELASFIINTLQLMIDKPNEFLSRYNKLLNDLLSICSIEWFIAKSLDEKLSILNRTYDFDHVLDRLIERKWIDKLKPIILMDYLTKMGYLNEVIRIAEGLVENNDTYGEMELLRIYDFLAVACREIGNYQKSIEYFQLYKDYCEYLEPERRKHSGIVALVRVAESYYLSGNKEKWNAMVTDIEKQLEHLTETERRGILKNLATASRRNHDFISEASYIAEALTIATGEDLADDSLLRYRLELILPPDINIDKEQLIRIENLEEHVKYYSLGKIEYNAFNFKKALEHFSRAFELIKKYHVVEKKLLTLKSLGYTHYQMKNYQAAKNTIKEVLQINENDLDSLAMYTALSFEMCDENARNTAIDRISKIFNPEIPEALDNDSFIGFLQRLLTLLVQTREKGREIDDLKVIARKSGLNVEDFYSDAGIILADIGISDTAISILELALDISEEPIKRSNILVNIASVYTNKDMHDIAIKYNEKALVENKANVIAIGNMAASYAHSLNYSRALKIVDEAISLIKNDETKEMTLWQLEYDKRVYEIMIKNRFNINQISSESDVIVESLKKADRLYLHLTKRNNREELDASMIIIGYAKAFENILKERILKPYYHYVRDIHFPNWRISRSPLKQVITEKGNWTLSPGGWLKIIEDINKGNNGITASFSKFISKKYESNILELIEGVCKPLKRSRDSGAHQQVLNFDEIVKKRPAIVENMNKLIDSLY